MSDVMASEAIGLKPISAETTELLPQSLGSY